MDEEDERILRVSFVVRPEKKDPEGSLRKIETELFQAKVKNDALVPNQVGPVEYNVLDLDSKDTKLLSTLEEENERRFACERKIQEIKERTRKQAERMMNFAEHKKQTIDADVARHRDIYDDVDRRHRECADELQDYVDVRDRCISLKILNELLSENNEALYHRITQITERLTVLRQSVLQADDALQRARKELREKADELDLPTDMLRTYVERAEATSESEIRKVERKDREIRELHGRWEAETRRKITETKQQAERARMVIVSSNEKLKLRLLALCKEVTARERTARMVMAKKKKTQHDFALLRKAVVARLRDADAKFNRERADVVALQQRLLEQRRHYSGDSVSKRLEEMDQEEQRATAERFHRAIDEIHRQKAVATKESEAKAKAVFEEISTSIGEMVAKNAREQIARRTAERAQLRKDRANLEAEVRTLTERHASLEKRKASKAAEVSAIVAKRAEARQRNESKLKRLREDVRQRWRRLDMSSRVCLRFLKSVFATVASETPDSKTVAACRDEVKRLLAVKVLTQSVEARQVLASKIQKQKNVALGAGMTRAELDAVATDLWKMTQFQERKDAELVAQIQRYEDTYDREFCYLGEPFLNRFLAEINTHDETAAEVEKNAPRLSARLLDVKLHHAHSRKSIDAEYLEAHKRMKARIQKDAREHEDTGDVGYDGPDLTIMHNTMERIGYDDEDVM